MSEPRIDVPLTEMELHFLSSAMYGNVDWGWLRNVQRREELRERFETAQSALKARAEAERLERSLR